MAENSIEDKELSTPVSEEQVENTASEEGTFNDQEEQTEASADESKGNAVEAELAEMKDKYIRLYSEFENFRKRTNKEKIDLIKTASESLITELLPVVDDFERAEKYTAEETDITKIREGYVLIQHKLCKVLEQKGMKPMEALHQEFDADLHEAITQIPAPSDDLKGKIVDVIEKGYILNDKPIRFAKVVIGN